MLNKGAQQVKQGDLEGGIASLRQLLEIEPENNRAWMWLGWAAVRQGDHRAAERFFRQAERLGHAKAREALEWLRR
jgi:Flp pilus assembly protein TadD